MFRLKTPHASPFAHMLRLFGYFLGSTTLIGILLQSSFSAPSFSTVASLLVTASLSLVIGLALTIVIRRLGNLTQTGRFLQYASFWLGSYCALLVATKLFPGAIWHDSPALESLLIFAFTFGPATFSRRSRGKAERGFRSPGSGRTHCAILLSSNTCICASKLRFSITSAPCGNRGRPGKTSSTSRNCISLLGARVAHML